MSPEKTLFNAFWKYFKKAFYLFIAVISYIQIYEYIEEKQALNITVTDSELVNDKYLTTFEFNNQNTSISKEDVFRPIVLNLNTHILEIFSNKKNTEDIGLRLLPKENRLELDFGLINKNESFTFKTLTDNKLRVNEIDYRIKDIDEIEVYHYKFNPQPVQRVLNIWIVVFIISIIMFLDAALLIAKDLKLGEIKRFVLNYPLSKKNRNEFLEELGKLYKEYKVKLKPPYWFFIDFKIKNLLDSFKYDKENIQLIKTMTNSYLDLFLFYRFRKVFIVVGPILAIVGILGIVFNYFYYDIDILSSISLNSINKYLLRTVLGITIMMILFHRRTLNFFLLKKDAKVKF